MDWLQSIDILGYIVSIWHVSFLWHSLLIFIGLTLVLYAYRKYSARVKCLIWAVSLPIMFVMPISSWMLFYSGIPVYEIVVLQSYRSVEITQVDETSTKQDSQAEEGRLFDYPYAIFFSVYCMIVLGIAGFFLEGRVRISRIAYRATPITDKSLQKLLEHCSRDLNISRTVKVRESADMPVPFTVGMFHPVIVLPSSLFSRISTKDKRHILLHELAHINRLDSPLLAFAAIWQALFFMNPFVWYAISRISTLAEEACDELVVKHSGEPVHYARILTSIAETTGNISIDIKFATGFVFSRFKFLRRIESILSKRRRGIITLSKMSAAALILLLGVLFAASIIFPLMDRNNYHVQIQQKKEMAQTPEKREAIEKIQELFWKYKRHFLVMKCVDLILDTDRNIAVIGKIAEYGIVEGPSTYIYVSIAEYAAKAPIADDEFIELAELVKRGNRGMVKLAQQASEAGNETELEEVRKKIKVLMN